MNIWLLVIMLLQSSMHAAFLTHYFTGSWRHFAVFASIFVFLLFPLTQLIPRVFLLANNLLDFVILAAACRHLYPHLGLRRILLGLILYWLPMPLSEVLGLSVTYVTIGDPRDLLRVNLLWGPVDVGFAMLQIYCSALMACLYLLILRKTRAYRDSQKIWLWLSALLAGMGWLAFLCLCLVYSVPFSRTLFTNIGAILFVLTLRRYARQQAASAARRLIQEEYDRQFRSLQQADASREALRRFRHDLINELEHEKALRT